MRSFRTEILVAFVVLVVATVSEFVFHERARIFTGPLGLCLLVVVVGFALFLLQLWLLIRRHRARVRAIKNRLSPLSNEQLTEIMRTPTHPDSQFALVELMKRGVDAKPTKDQLFDMLTSGNPRLCGTAMTHLGIFYPELTLPEGSSNLDSPEVWRSRVDEFRRAG
jgi:hypothetical protein